MDKFLIVALMIVDSVIGAFGAMQLKLGSEKINLKVKKIYRNIYNKHLITGIFLYALALCLVIYLFSKAPLSLIYPLTSITYIFTVLFSKWFLKEKITKIKWIAISIIIIGNVMLTYKI